MIEFISSRFFLSKFILLLVLGTLFATGCAEMENELIELERSEQEISQIKDEEESINKENEILTKANGLEERLLDVEEDKEKRSSEEERLEKEKEMNSHLSEEQILVIDSKEKCEPYVKQISGGDISFGEIKLGFISVDPTYIEEEGSCIEEWMPTKTDEWVFFGSEGDFYYVEVETLERSTFAGPIIYLENLNDGNQLEKNGQLSESGIYKIFVSANSPGAYSLKLSHQKANIDKPDSPSIISLEPGNSMVTIKWEAPEADVYGDVPVTVDGYSVGANLGFGDDDWQSEVITVGNDIQSVTIGGLTNGVKYNFFVYATNEAGNSKPASTIGDLYNYSNATARPSIPSPFASNAGTVFWESPRDESWTRGCDLRKKWNLEENTWVTANKCVPEDEIPQIYTTQCDWVGDELTNYLLYPESIPSHAGCVESVISKEGEIDEWTFDAKAGQWVDIRMEATYYGSKDQPTPGTDMLRPILELVAPNLPEEAELFVPLTNETVPITEDISCYVLIDTDYCSTGIIGDGETKGGEFVSTLAAREKDHWIFTAETGEIYSAILEWNPAVEDWYHIANDPYQIEVRGPSTKPEACWPYNDRRDGQEGAKCKGFSSDLQGINLVGSSISTTGWANNNGRYEVLNFTIRDSGIHTIAVSGFANGAGAYKISLERVKSAPPIWSNRPTVPPSVLTDKVIKYSRGAESDCWHSSETDECIDTVVASIDAKNEVDSYLFFARGGESVVIDAIPTDTNMETYMELISPTGVLEAYNHGEFEETGSIVNGSVRGEANWNSDAAFIGKARNLKLKETGWYTIKVSAPPRPGSVAYFTGKPIRIPVETGTYALRITYAADTEEVWNETTTLAANSQGNVPIQPNAGLCPSKLLQPLTNQGNMPNEKKYPHQNCVALAQPLASAHGDQLSELAIRRKLTQDGTYTIRARGITGYRNALTGHLEGNNIGTYRLELYVSDSGTPMSSGYSSRAGVLSYPGSGTCPWTESCTMWSNQMKLIENPTGWSSKLKDSGQYLSSDHVQIGYDAFMSVLRDPEWINIGETKHANFSYTKVPTRGYEFMYPSNAFDASYAGYSNCIKCFSNGGFFNFEGTTGQIITIVSKVNRNTDGSYFGFGVELISPEGVSQAEDILFNWIKDEWLYDGTIDTDSDEWAYFFKAPFVVISNHSLRETGTYKIKVYSVSNESHTSGDKVEFEVDVTLIDVTE